MSSKKCSTREVYMQSFHENVDRKKQSNYKVLFNYCQKQLTEFSDYEAVNITSSKIKFTRNKKKTKRSLVARSSN